MKRILIAVVMSVLVLGLSLVTTSAAEGKEGAQTKTGTVKKVDVAGKQVVVMVTRELTFTVTDATKIQQSGNPKTLADIKVDGKVSVDYVKEGEARNATKIVILKEK